MFWFNHFVFFVKITCLNGTNSVIVHHQSKVQTLLVERVGNNDLFKVILDAFTRDNLATIRPGVDVIKLFLEEI